MPVVPKNWQDRPTELDPLEGESVKDWLARITTYEATNPGTLTALDAAALIDLETRVGAYVDTQIAALNFTPPDASITPAKLSFDPATQVELDAVAGGIGTPNVQAVSYTLVAADAGKAIEMNAAGATTLTVPPNSAVAFPIGTVIEVLRYGAGAVTLAPGAGVTIHSNGGKVAIANQYSSASLRKRATDEWVLNGDLA